MFFSQGKKKFLLFHFPENSEAYFVLYSRCALLCFYTCSAITSFVKCGIIIVLKLHVPDIEEKHL